MSPGSVIVYAAESVFTSDHDELTAAIGNVQCDEDDAGVLEYYRELAHELSV